MTNQTTLQGLQCSQCGHVWLPRFDRKPGTCPNPKCRSTIWDKPKRVARKDATT